VFHVSGTDGTPYVAHAMRMTTGREMGQPDHRVFRPSLLKMSSATPEEIARKHPSLVTFTLLRGGPTSADYELFTSSRRCLWDAVGDAVEYDDIAFHEGNVPFSVQLSLRLKMYAASHCRCLSHIFACCWPLPVALYTTPRHADSFGHRSSEW
jgi:hypothetical protein